MLKDFLILKKEESNNLKVQLSDMQKKVDKIYDYIVETERRKNEYKRN